MESIFKEIVHVMHHDYSGYEDKKGWDNPNYFLQKIKELMVSKKLTKELFTEIVKDYLLDFEDQHIYFEQYNSTNKELKDRGFRVRRFENKLYVTEVGGESRIKRGMFFNSLGGYSIPELAEFHKRLICESSVERENWSPILSLYSYGELVDLNGNLSLFSMNFYEKSPYTPTYTIRSLKENVLLITITDFMDSQAILNMIKENHQLLEITEHWIIDVRTNYGGSDSSFFPLLPHILPEEGIDLADSDEKMYFNCTNTNTELQLAELNKYIENTNEKQSLLFLNVFKKEWEKNKGKGFVEFNFDELFPTSIIKGKRIPNNIFILTDCMCGSSGDSFVEICKKSRKVTVIGRPTKGLNDYTNLISMKWNNEFELMYPTSRLSRIDKGQGMSGIGIKPHIYIPWSPNHLEEDIDLNAATSIIASSSV
ncbi:S41 family peptidase [Bacillus sp. EAC]|uniref:S41 family peptidase n=1 Tax=Bacillus sp. EAC TaxID=1978338 RepID=UPI000B434E33|nr:S41 family peptidase [Bacillus sp. EAC]